MTIIYVLIPLSLVLLGLAVWAFFWAVKNDQFDDLDTPAMDILDDEEQRGSGDEEVECRGERKSQDFREKVNGK